MKSHEQAPGSPAPFETTNHIPEDQKAFALQYLKLHDELLQLGHTMEELGVGLEHSKLNHLPEVTGDRTEFDSLSAQAEAIKAQMLSLFESMDEETRQEFLSVKEDEDGNRFTYNAQGELVRVH